MVAYAPSGGFYVSCFVCGDDPEYICLLDGKYLGEPIQLERAVCLVCSAVILSLKMPIEIAESQVLLRVAFFLPLPGMF
jgi:hypothetical protein